MSCQSINQITDPDLNEDTNQLMNLLKLLSYTIWYLKKNTSSIL